MTKIFSNCRDIAKQWTISEIPWCRSVPEAYLWGGLWWWCILSVCMYMCVCVCGVLVQVDRILPHSYHRYVKLVRRLCSLLKVTSASAGQLCFISILTLAPSPTPAPPSSSPAELQLRATELLRIVDTSRRNWVQKTVASGEMFNDCTLITTEGSFHANSRMSDTAIVEQRNRRVY